MPVIDTHAHIYSEDAQTYPLRENPLLPPRGTGTLTHMKQTMRDNHVNRIVMVHTSTAYHWDNRLVADMVAVSRDFASGVCTLDPSNPDSPMLLEHYASLGIKGLRLYVVDNTYESAGHYRRWEKCEELGLVVCSLMNPPFLPALARLLKKFSNVPTVLDHCANLTAADFPGSDNLKAVLDMAQYSNLHAKVSFLVTGSEENYPCQDTHQLGYQIIETFGSRRCLWGSDFPCELWLRPDVTKNTLPKATYAQHLRIFTHDLQLSRSARQNILNNTAQKLFFS